MGNGSSSTVVSGDRKKKVYESQDDFVRSLINNNLRDSDQLNHFDVGKQSPVDTGCSTDQVDSKVMEVDFRNYDFPFENLVFEGGGNKGLAYCGAVQVLEEIGLYKNIKRLAGTSAGAMTATLLAVGYNAGEIREFLSQDLSSIFLDHSWGYFSLLPNLISGYGWNPGEKIYNWFGDVLDKKTGNPDVTFREIYQTYKKELCVVVTNVNMMTEEYFHAKTTPDVPVRVALRMTISMPGLFQVMRCQLNGVENVYVDGGLLCNYPINCFDGWWLSMKMEDSFLNRLKSLEMMPKLFDRRHRFGTYNNATLGFLLYADNEKDILQEELKERVGTEVPPFPDTKLGRNKQQQKNLQQRVNSEYQCILDAVNALFKVLEKHNLDKDDKISMSELTNALSDTAAFPNHHAEKLFGKAVTVDDVMASLDKDKNGKVDFHELVHFIERTGVSLQTRFLGYKRTEIEGLFSYFDALHSTLLTNVKRIYVEERDVERTVGINTGHVGTTDFDLEPADREFAVMQGRRAAEAYLRYYVTKYNPPKRTSSAV